MEAAAFSDLRLREVLDSVGRPGLPGAGSVAGVVAGLAAGLVAMSARGTEGWDDAGAVIAQAKVLQERLEALAREDAEAYADALETLDAARGDFALGTALGRAADVPLRIAETAADTAALAASTSGRCDPRYQADATAAAILAAAAARAAAELVAVNLTALEGDPRVARARAVADEAARAASV